MISVCVTTYNGERYIKEQLLSVLAQLTGDDEVVVSDDGSTDATLAVVSGIGSPRIRVFKNTGEHGYTPNFENALRHAKGDYIFLCDQDDLWEADKVSVCMDYLRRYDLVISDATVVDADNKVIGESYCSLRHSKPGLLHNLIRFSYLGCCMAFSRRVLDKALPFPPDHKRCTHDNWLALVGMVFGKAVIIPNKLIRYRRYGSNTSAGGLKKTTSAWFKVEYRLYLLCWLLKRALRKRG